MTPYKRSLSAIFLLTALITGCGSDSNKNATISINKQKSTKPVTISGLVSDKNGPVKSGKIIAKDANGKTVVSSNWKDDTHYSIKVPTGTEYPIELAAVGAKQKLTVAIISPSTNKHDISPISTKIATKAKSLGGYTPQNLTQAALTTTAIPDSDRTVGGFKGDPTKQFGGWH